MIQDKTTYIARSYWQSTFLNFRKAFALCLKVFKVVDLKKEISDEREFYLVVDENDKMICTSCEQCMIICPTNCLTVKGNKHLGHLDHLSINRNECISCYLCQDVCPEDALYLGNKRKSADNSVK